MSERRWRAGDTVTVNGLQFRVVRGDKRPRGPGDDLVLEVWAGGQWRRVKAALAGIVIDFCCENEEFLFPQSLGYKGRNKLIEYMHDAGLVGWQVAEAALMDERRKAGAA